MRVILYNKQRGKAFEYERSSFDADKRDAFAKGLYKYDGRKRKRHDRKRHGHVKYSVTLGTELIRLQIKKNAAVNERDGHYDLHYDDKG
jgi:hypothetical protein